ncbi:hypothetical protein BvCmsSIP076_00822 [Escherichia coli]|nr:hypothetical protein BvCmsSIP076_00822 [Escherichia coli]
MYSGIAAGKGGVSHVAQAVQGADKVRVDRQPLRVHGVRHPVAAFTFQNAGKVGGNKLVDAPVIAQILRQQGEGGIVL